MPKMLTNSHIPLPVVGNFPIKNKYTIIMKVNKEYTFFFLLKRNQVLDFFHFIVL
jgi:hypothetical protein